MKLFLAILATVSCASAATVFQSADGLERGISQDVEAKIEGLKVEMPCGFPGIGIPPLAPIKAEQRSISINTTSFGFDGLVRKFRLYGLDSFRTNQFRINPLTSRVTGDYTFKKIFAIGDFDAKAFVKKYGFTIRLLVDNGQLYFAINDFNLKFDIRYTVSVLTNKVRVRSFKVIFHVGSVDSQTTGFLGEGAVNQKTNEIVEEFVELLINDNQEEITKDIENAILGPLNNYLSQYTLKQLIAGGGGGGSGGGGGGPHQPKPVCVPPIID